MKLALSVIALSVLAACGGGGGESQTIEATAPAVTDVKASPAVVRINPNCVWMGHQSCELIPGELEIGVPPHTFAAFTNKTGQALRIDDLQAVTNERQYWSEWCAYIDVGSTWQTKPGVGEVGCVSKAMGQDYPVLKGGLRVEPGQVVYLNSHTEPAAINHSYQLRVSVADVTASYAWRQPSTDQVFTCDGSEQSTKWSGWTNTTGRMLTMTGASVYSESANPAARNTVKAACVHVFDVNGQPTYSNCSLQTAGEVAFGAVAVHPGETVFAQATNSCSAPAFWGWAAFIRIH